MSFQETGNKVPISADELSNYVTSQLQEFDLTISKKKTIPEFNPYIHPIIYKTKDGKTIKIPEGIQKQAVDLWYQKTGKNIPLMQQMQQQPQPQPQPQPQQEIQSQEMQLPKKVIYVYENDTSLIRLGILIFAAVLALFLFFKMNNSSSSPFNINTEQLRYYLTK